MTNSTTAVAVCPRCRSSTVEVRGRSAVAGVWTVFGCDTCFYVWRSTEPDENTDPKKYPVVFRLNLDELSKLPAIPTLRPKRQPTENS
jgi:vanillate/4-hydroxybenzoate decarboxylase subunit D